MKAFPSILINCKQASEFIQQKELGRLPFQDALKLKIHLWYCRLCRLYEKQSAKINQLLEQHFKASKPSDNTEFKDRLKAEVRKKGEK